MKISDILAKVDEIKPSQIDDNTKISWLSELDGRIFNNVIMTHEHELVNEEVEDPETGEITVIQVEPKFTAYTSEDAELLIPDVYADVYRYWIYAMMDFSTGETDRYQNSMIMFNTKYQEFVDYYNSNVKPIQRPLKLI